LRKAELMPIEICEVKRPLSPCTMRGCRRSESLGDSGLVEDIDIVHAEHRTPPPRRLQMRLKVRLINAFPAWRVLNRVWALPSTRVKPRGVEQGMASGIARTAKGTALMGCIMQAVSPPDALVKDIRIQGERRASYTYCPTIGIRGSTTGVCDFGGPVVSSVAMVATSCRRLRPSGWASAARRWRAVSVRRSRRPPYWAVRPWCSPAPR
jgi:hypothetical protein